MIPILTPEQVKKADAIAMNEYKIPSIILMENAARSAAKIIRDIINSYEVEYPKIAILCGSGNNGGDGFAIARHLHELYDISIFWIGSKEKMSNETKTNLEICSCLDINIANIDLISDIILIDDSYDIIIDSLIGIGGSENIKGITLDILKHISDLSSLNIAIDVPTGLNALTGIANEYCFRADYTITMFSEKTGLILNQGKEFSGQIFTAYLGAPETIPEDLAEIFSLEPEDLDLVIPKRKQNSSKFDYGKALVIAGSAKYSGAAALTANACTKSGAGLTYLYTPKIHNAVYPEIIILSNESNEKHHLNLDDFKFLKESLNNFSSIAIGPGLDTNDSTIEFVKTIIEYVNPEIPIIIDADALKAIETSKTYRKNIILTPHIGEFSRLIGLSREEITKNQNNIVKEWASKLNCTIILKGSPSIISDGNSTFWNIYGNPALAKGGSGDVLTGILAGFMAKGPDFNPTLTAACACLVHSLAADNYIENNSIETLLASDLINNLPNILP